MKDEKLVDLEISIGADPETVFEFFTDARALLEWMAVEAEAEPVPGGRLRWRHRNGAVMSGKFVEVTRPTRLVFTYGWEEGGLPVPPGSTVVEIDLRAEGEGTRLHLVHRHLPAPLSGEHRHGWEYFLGILAERAKTGLTRRTEGRV